MLHPSELDNCPCFSGRSFGSCCGTYLLGNGFAPTAETLMRSRYAAYATHNFDYLEATLLPEQRGEYDRETASLWSRSSEWIGLEILSVQKGTETDTTGLVEFIAHYNQNGQDLQHHETSRFARKDNIWYYVDDVRPANQVRVSKTGRNDPCTCGSGKKYKRCCGR